MTVIRYVETPEVHERVFQNEIILYHNHKYKKGEEEEDRIKYNPYI